MMEQWECWTIGRNQAETGERLTLCKEGVVMLDADLQSEDKLRRIAGLLNDQEKLREIVERTLSASDKGYIKGLYGPLHAAMKSVVRSDDKKVVDVRLLSPQVRATAYSDDRIFEVSLLVAQWFAQASDKEILDLARVEWANEYAADQVALHFEETNDAMRSLLSYTRNTQGRRNPVGFECQVNGDDAIQWLKLHRPHLVGQVIELVAGWPSVSTF